MQKCPGKVCMLPAQIHDLLGGDKQLSQEILYDIKQEAAAKKGGQQQQQPAAVPGDPCCCA